LLFEAKIFNDIFVSYGRSNYLQPCRLELPFTYNLVMSSHPLSFRGACDEKSYMFMDKWPLKISHIRSK